MTLKLRYMTLNDVPQVVAIDRWSFSSPWTARTYAYEVAEAEQSHMMVLERPGTPPRLSGWRRFLKSLTGAADLPGTLLAYGGLWLARGEGHISTIASHPEYRGKGYGEIALVAMLRRSVTLGATYAALEVRVTNVVAQRLYLKYGFQVYSTRPRYYRDNGEDAYDMRLVLTPEVCEQIETSFAALLHRYRFEDTYTAMPYRNTREALNHTPNSDS